VENNTRLIVLRSLTKIFALPGLRLAFLAAHPRVMARMTPLVEPWPLSSQAITAGHFCLSRVGFKEDSLAAVMDFRQSQRQALEALNLGRLFPSECNFMLLKLRSELESQALIEHLFGCGILVRDASNFVGLRPGFIRLAVRPPEEVEALVKGLDAFLSQ
jgi:Histidinol-phosphate/aromatic aminotransferase and cobyric acid decarboxylase